MDLAEHSKRDANQVPYKKMRGFVALMGSLTIPVIFGIMRESGYPVVVAAFSACLVLFGESCEEGIECRSKEAGLWIESERADVFLRGVGRLGMVLGVHADNAHVTQSRLILLDAALILFMSLSLLCYIKFHQYRYQ
jgi:dolichyl-phosphate-mannose-protein mannosyltransferase